MSDLISSTLGALGAVSQILGGTTPVQLGDVVLQGFEVPERLTFGGKQSHIVHDFPGGRRIVDAMGAFESDITWSGFMSGSSSVSRARRLDAIRKTGEAVRLSWADFSKRVLVTSFECEYEKNGGMCPYKISCVVVSSADVEREPTLLERLAGSVGEALGVTKADVSGLVDRVQTATAQAQAALPLVGVVAGPRAMVAASDALARAGGVSSGLQSALDGRMAGLGTAATAVGVGGPAGAIVAAAAAASALATTTSVAASMGSSVARIRLG